MNPHSLKAMRCFVVATLISTALLASCSKQNDDKTSAERPVADPQSKFAQPATLSGATEAQKESTLMPRTTPAIAGNGEREGPPNPAAPRSDPRLRPPLIGTGRTGPQNPVPPYVQKVAVRVGAEMAGLKTNDPAIPVKFAKLWKTAWPSSFNVPLRVGSTADIAVGRALPREVTDYRSQRECFTTQLQSGELGFITNNDEREAAYMMFGLAVGDAQSGGGNLIRAIADRVNQLPPAKGDVVLFYIVSQALRDLRRGGSNATTFADLLPLAEGRNPLYRLLALQASYNAVTNLTRNLSSENPQAEVALAPARTAFYQMYLSESDPVILREAVQAMGAVPSLDAKAALQRFRAAQQQAGNAELVTAADEALRSCESLLATLKSER